MKKFLCTLLAAVLLLSLLAPALAEGEDLPTYIFGGASNKNRAKLKTMGQQGWYLMYSTQVNAGETIDLTTFKECVLTETGMWKPGETVQLPLEAPDAAEDAVASYSGEWFLIRKDGLLAPDTGFSAALKWVCENEGVYDFVVGYSGGSSSGYAAEGHNDPNGGYWVPASDGVYMSAWIKRAEAQTPEKLMFVDTWTYEGHTLSHTDEAFDGVELKAGDEVWLVCDPKLNGGWDSPWWCVTLTRVGELAK